MGRVFRILLAFSSVLLVLVVYVTNIGYKDSFSFIRFLCDGYRDEYGLYIFSVIIALAFVIPLIGLFISKCMMKDCFERGDVVTIKHVGSEFVPSYLGYFFVALSISSIQTLLVVCLLISIFVYNSQIYYFNPIYMIFGYKFYSVELDGGVVVLLISRKCYRIPADIEIPVVYRINDYSFIEV